MPWCEGINPKRAQKRSAPTRVRSVLSWAMTQLRERPRSMARRIIAAPTPCERTRELMRVLSMSARQR